MSCEICGRGACVRSFHSIEAQERFEAKQAMSDDVDDLREEIIDMKSRIADDDSQLATLRAEVERLRAALEDIKDTFGNIDHQIDAYDMRFIARAALGIEVKP